MDWKKLPMVSMGGGHVSAWSTDGVWRGLPVGPAQWPPPPTPATAGRPAVFIDKDGAFVEGPCDGVDPARLRFHEGAPEALAALAQAGFALVVVTNQGGIERGYFSRAQFAVLQACIEKRLLAHSGVALTDFVVCPHAPGPGDQPRCLCRLPASGLLVRAARQHRIDLKRSWMVGHTLDGVEAGRRAGCRSILFAADAEAAGRRSPLRTPDRACPDWDNVVHEVLGGGGAAGVHAVPPARGTTADCLLP